MNPFEFGSQFEIDLLGIDQELLKGAVSGEGFPKYFFANCKNDEIANYIKKVLA